MLPFVLVFCGGGMGAVCRYLTGRLITRWLGLAFPFGTMAANLIGAFCIGLIVELLALKLQAPEPWRLMLVTGFLGGYTTFSAFALETALMIERGAILPAAAYVLVTVLGTVALVFAATWLVRHFA